MPVTCKICNSNFSTQSNLNKHCQKKHNIKRQIQSFPGNMFNYKCLDCDCSFRASFDFIEHLKIEHLHEIFEQKMKFANFEDFKSWKVEIENEDKCNYISASKKTSKSGDEIQYFHCNRSGTRKDRMEAAIDIVNRKRSTKTQGSVKLNYACISKITLKKIEGRFCATRIINHYGHSADIQHLRINDFDRQQLASKLVNGVSKEKILDEIQSNIHTDLKRIDLLTKRDLDNIKRSYNIHQQDGANHSNDTVSVDAWVKECKSSENNPVLIYKPQGKPLNGFSDNDFCLIIMNTFQASLLSQFGQNVIAIDSTHDLSNYDFQLTTIMVIDDFNEGFPVALMFSNRKDTHIHVTFFNAIRQKVGIINCKTFMSDITETIFNAWAMVMGTPEHQLYCSWHIDRDWKTNLSKICKQSKKSVVYKVLKYLQRDTIAEEFHKQLHIAIDNMIEDSDTKIFGEYFSNFYAENYLKWAYCFQNSCGINTNTKLESLYKVIKYFNFDSKCVKQLDKSLHSSVKYIRDKTLNRLIKHTKGKPSIYTQENFKRHRLALLTSFQISENDNEEWTISLNDNDYIVQRLPILEKCCNLDCQYCEICVHQYSCNCPDSFIDNLICKHIHFVAFKNNQ